MQQGLQPGGLGKNAGGGLTLLKKAA